MAITSYTKPQSEIHQLLERIAAPAVPRMGAVILAAKYILNRWGKESTAPAAAFATAGQSLTYDYVDELGASQTLPATHTVDQDAVTLYGTGLEASLATFTAVTTNKFHLKSLLTPSIIELSADNVKGGTLDALLLGRDVKVGDIAYADDGSGPVRRKVIALLGDDVASTFGTNGASNDSLGTDSNYNPITDSPVTGANPVIISEPVGHTTTVVAVASFDAMARGSLINNRYGEEFTITVRTGGAPATATVDITSKTGLWSATNVATVDNTGDHSITDTNAGGELAGIEINITTGGIMVKGEQYVFEVYGPYVRLVSGTDYTIAGTYTGPRDTTYVLEVVTGSSGDDFEASTLRITDTNGVDTVQTVNSFDATNGAPVAFALGSYGLTFEFEEPAVWTAHVQGGLRAGDKYYVNAKAATQSATDFNKVVLDGPAANTTTFTNIATALVVEFRIESNGFIARDAAADDSAWAPTATTIAVDSALSLYVSDRDPGSQWPNFVDAVGTLTPSWRAAVPAGSGDGMISITSTQDILDNCGTIDIDNDAGYGVAECFDGAQGRTVYWVNTGGESVADHAQALVKISNTDIISFIGLTSEDSEVQDTLKTHVESLSAPTKKQFRRFYGGINSPGEYVEIGLQSDLSPHTATIDDLAGENVLVRFTSSIDLSGYTIVSGDKLRLTADPDNIVEYVIDSVVSDTELQLQAGPGAPVSPAVPIQVWRQNSADSQGDYVIERAKALDSRRAILIWQESGKRTISGVPTVIDNRYIACHIAGLRSALLPQQGLTRTEVNTITSAPSMYNKYTQDDLDRIASNGLFEVTQEFEDGPVFIRHQLTTDVDNGILYYEDSVGVTVDYISFLIKDAIGGFIGKRNVTADTLADIEAIVEDILVQQTEVPYNASYGPALTKFENLVVEADANLKDRVNVDATLFVAVPLNSIVVKLHVTA